MTENGFDLPPKAPPDVLAQRNALAEEVCRTLILAGIPTHRGDFGGDSEPAPGAEVHVDPLVTGGVLVEWNTEAELTSAAVNLLAGGVDPSDLPHAIRHYETVQTSMRDALTGILSSAGFQTEQADGHTYGTAVFVKSGRP
ncbi:hypothetical protein [Streptomyces sp. SID3212]|uniref:hypothetical protein n=1 Tax=Streptomyces sp. SID3212 TaxID=2690259 RepID=UPI00137163DB|nr:hypothetical protein [Streptomyces sp. SID3212]MYV56695.1 hypothetical protein [Streptomyces sp. SID3212]